MTKDLPIIHCKYDELVNVEELVPFDKNRNQHTKEQLERLAELIEFYGHRAPVVVATAPIRCIAKGHGTVMTYKMKGWSHVPVVYQEFGSYDELYGYVQSDNAIASWAGLDLPAIHADLPELHLPKIELLGIKDFAFEPEFSPGSEDDQSQLDEKAPTVCPECGHSWVK